MITIFNRRELIITRSMEEQIRVRNKLNECGIDYRIKTNRGHSRSFASERAYTGSLGERQDAMYEYRIFVKKEDYEKARRLI